MRIDMKEIMQQASISYPETYAVSQVQTGTQEPPAGPSMVVQAGSQSATVSKRVKKGNNKCSLCGSPDHISEFSSFLKRARTSLTRRHQNQSVVLFMASTLLIRRTMVHLPGLQGIDYFDLFHSTLTQPSTVT